jgi:hypothetical protein
MLMDAYRLEDTDAPSNSNPQHISRVQVQPANDHGQHSEPFWLEAWDVESPLFLVQTLPAWMLAHTREETPDLGRGFLPDCSQAFPVACSD